MYATAVCLRASAWSGCPLCVFRGRRVLGLCCVSIHRPAHCHDQVCLPMVLLAVRSASILLPSCGPVWCGVVWFSGVWCAGQWGAVRWLRSAKREVLCRGFLSLAPFGPDVCMGVGVDMCGQMPLCSGPPHRLCLLSQSCACTLQKGASPYDIVLRGLMRIHHAHAQCFVVPFAGVLGCRRACIVLVRPGSQFPNRPGGTQGCCLLGLAGYGAG